MGGSIIARGIGLGLIALLLNVAAAFLWVWFYSVALAPGHDGAFYQAYAQRVAPLAAMLTGVPVLFAAGWLMTTRGGAAVVAAIPAGTYILLDLVLNGAGGLWPSAPALILLYLLLIAAALAGGWLAARRRAPQ